MPYRAQIDCISPFFIRITLSLLCMFIAACSSGRTLQPVDVEGAPAMGNSEIESVSVFRESDSEVTFRVSYQYDGSFGEVYYKDRRSQVAMLGVQTLLKGKATGCGKSRSVVIKKGSHIAYPALALEGFAARQCASDQLVVLLYMPGKPPGVVKIYSFEKKWT